VKSWVMQILSPTDGKPIPGIVEGLWDKVLLKGC